MPEETNAPYPPPQSANPWSSATVPPPPPMGTAGAAGDNPWASEAYQFPFKLSAGKGSKRDRVSEFRTGEIVLAPTFVRVYGKAVYPETTYNLILIASFFTIGLLIGYVLVELVMRQQRDEMLSWNDVNEIVLQPEKQRACLVYRLPRAPKYAYALGFMLDPIAYGDFTRTAQRYAPQKVRTGKILSTTTLWVWILLGLVLAFLFGLMVWAGASSSTTTGVPGP